MEAVDERIERLSAASLRRIIEPETELVGSIGEGGGGMVIPRELLSVCDLNLELTGDQWERLAREEVASILDAGIRFEAMLMAGFGLLMAEQRDLTDPRVTYILHEVGEETRHSRLFARVLADLQPTAVNVFTKGPVRFVDKLIGPRLMQCKALFCVMVLTGEEAPDLIQKRSSEHPKTDPFLREVNRYHRLEEARHLSFARTLLPEVWSSASRLERLLIRRVAPRIMTDMFDSLVQPGVYRTVGLPGWRTWFAVRKTESRRQLRAEAFRPILGVLREAGVFGSRGIPRAWRRACMVGPDGAPIVCP